MTSLSEKYQTTLEDKYILPRNNSERDRLQTQHRLFTEILGGRLIVDQTIRIKPGDRVLDSGTGAASEILGGRLIVDKPIRINPGDRVLDSADVPSNVKLPEMPSLSLPSDWDGSFDFVNQRLLIGAFTVEQWKMALSGYFRVLRPGGVLQLIETGLFISLHDSDSLPATKLANEF
ncbi:S-adenosyl-L-methionine-dependent methyltransferase [Sanghuangporus baumii]|uniref:S-adenosyl-L-methionine-dependent methyltransferase n=1 Tax=Sanghuangporus baumii TaxID=108892 RepID=A0A9Q5HX11_SANBA|nr:S-adenosyl-L-methionine-dependent methyltransferase [Sanghuangporus baumii]